MTPSSKPWTSILLPLSLALGVAGYLLYHATGDGAPPLGCGGNSGCNAVLGSRWSRWLNIPVAGLAAACYAGLIMLTLIFLRTKNSRIKALAQGLIIPLCVFGLGSILWFVGLQLAVIKRICAWCMTDHLLGAISFVLVLWALQFKPRQWVTSSLPAGAGLAAFIAIHILFPPMMMDIRGQETATTDNPSVETANIQIGKKQRREVSLYNDEITFDIYKVPVIGDREAPYVIMELFCYTCKYCRGLHPQMKAAQRRYGIKNVTLIILPAPLNVQCNSTIIRALPEHRYACSYAQYGMAMNVAAPEKFEEFHDWMMTGETPPLLSEVRKRAYEMVDKETFDAAVKSQKVKDWIKDGVAIFKHFDADAIPKIITDKRVANVVPTSLENLYIGLDRMTGLKPQ